MPTVRQKREAKNREEDAVVFYISEGWTPEQALGIVGNLLRESGLNPNAVGDGGKAFGLAQWHPDRQARAKKLYGDEWKTFENQLKFVHHELNTTEKAAGDKLRASKGVWEAGRVVSDDFERPKVKYSADETRQQHVSDLAMRLKGIIVTPKQETTSYANNVAPYLNQQQTTAVNQLEIPIINANFAGVSESNDAEKEKTEEDKQPLKEAEAVREQTNEYNFLKNYQEQYAQQEQQPIQIPTIDVEQTVNDVSQFVDGAAQQGRRPVQLQDERALVQRDATQVSTQRARPLQQLNVINKTDKEIATEREAKIQASIEAQKVPYTKENWRRQLAAETAATGDKLRVSNEPNFFDDYLNPAAMIGSMASNLGQAPLQAEQSNSVLPYITSIGAPLAVGALAGLGTKNTGQFVNNLANPLAGTGELVNSLGNKYLPNAYKLNPNAFKPNSNNFYRQVDNMTYNEGLESGLIRGKQDIGHSGVEGINLNKSFGDDAYYNKGNLYYTNNKDLPYLFEANLPEDKFLPKVNGRTRKYTTENTSVRVSKEPLPINDPNIKTYKKDWLQGYKQVEVPKTTPIKDLFIQPKQKFSNPNLSDIEEPYISKKVFNDSKEQQVFESSFQPEQQSRLLEERTKYYDNRGNEIPKPDRFLQQGGKPIEDNLGYWNPKNWGKNVKIDGGNITMEKVGQPLVGKSDKGETKLMLPEQNYTFKDAKYVVESPLTKEEQMFLEEYGKLQVAQQGKREFELRERLPSIERDATQIQKPTIPKYFQQKQAPTLETLKLLRPDLKKGEGIYYGEGDNKTYLSPDNILSEVVVQGKKKERSGKFDNIKIKDESLEAISTKDNIDIDRATSKEVETSIKSAEKLSKDVNLSVAKAQVTFNRRSNDLDVKEGLLKKADQITKEEDILAVQQKLKRAGYNLNPEGKFKNGGLDGKMGKITAQAIEDYNNSGEKLKYTGYKTGEGFLGRCREDQCSEFVQNEIFRNTKPNVSRQQWVELTGLQGDAWRIGDNIINSGGAEVKGAQVKPGDTITMYTGGLSSYLPQAKKYGTDATHIGVVDKVNPDGSYYILHNVHEGSKEDGYSGREYRDLVKNGKIESESIKRNFTIRGVYRPNYEAIKDYEKKVKVRDDVSIKINENSLKKLYKDGVEGVKPKITTYLNSLNDINTKKILSSKYGLTETDYQSLAKASLGILAQESKFGTSKKLIPKQIVATAMSFVGLKRDEVSKGAGQLKYDTNYGDSDLVELGINKDNFTDDDKAILPVFDRLTTYYKSLVKKEKDKESAIYKSIEKYNLGSNTKYADEKDTDYVNKVLKYSDIFKVTDEDNVEYNTLTDKLNLDKNIIKKQIILTSR